jgi:hypothetical protein
LASGAAALPCVLAGCVVLLLGFGAGFAAGFDCENPTVVITLRAIIRAVFFMFCFFKSP